MTDHGYHNSYYAQEWNQWENSGAYPYQQYNQYPHELNRSSKLEDTLNLYMQYSVDKQMEREALLITKLEDVLSQFMQVSISNQNRINASIHNLEFQVGQIAIQLATWQESINTHSNTQPNLIEPERSNRSNERIEERIGVNEDDDEENIVDQKGEEEESREVERVVEENETNEGESEEELIEKEEENTQERVKENKAEIDQVIYSIIALFIKSQLEETGKPQRLYLKFMDFLQNKRKKKDEIFFLSYWPP